MDEGKPKKNRVGRSDLNALEADKAYFDARLSLAGDRQDTAYQKAQKKTYETLGRLMSGTIEQLRRKPKD